MSISTPPTADRIAPPVATNPPAPTKPCRECDGTGVRKFVTGGLLSDWVAVPCRCGAGENGGAR